MTDASAPKVNRRTLLDGHGRRRPPSAPPGWAWATTGSARGSRVSRSAGKKVIVIGVDGMDPRLSEQHDEGGPAPQPREAPGRRGLQHPGHEHAAAEPRRLGQLHQRGRAGLHGIFDFIHRHPAGAVRPVLLGRRDRARRGGLGGGRPPAPARLLAVQPQAARAPCSGARAPRSGTTSTPRASPRRSTTCRPTTRPARRTTATTAASAAWARRTCWGPTAPTSTSPRTARPSRSTKAGGKRSRLTFEDETARARIVGPEDSLLKKPRPIDRRVPRPPRPRGQRGGDRDPGPANSC